MPRKLESRARPKPQGTRRRSRFFRRRNHKSAREKLIASTSGFLYKSIREGLPRYPIPDLRLPPGRGERFLDVGSSWGRWSVAAARKGYAPVSLAPSLGAVL